LPVTRFQKKSTRRKRLRQFARFLLVVLLFWAWQVLFVVTLINAYGQVDHAQPADVIIVLGAGLRADNTPGPALTRRSLHAADLWRRGLAPVIICTGGKPGNRTRPEADACAELLRAEGVPAEAILQETESRSTEENALYTRTMIEARGWHSAILVSDGYHLFRAQHLFSNQAIPVYTSPVTKSSPGAIEYAVFIGREIMALHWQLLKETFNIPVTYVQSL
jgi:uncharacterized SAM-binding protein YcdF (DUF218 family)